MSGQMAKKGANNPDSAFAYTDIYILIYTILFLPTFCYFYCAMSNVITSGQTFSIAGVQQITSCKVTPP